MGVCSMTHIVVFDTSFIPRKGSSTSGERRTQGANTMARELGDILLCSSSFATLKRHTDQDLAGFLSQTNKQQDQIITMRSEAF